MPASVAIKSPRRGGARGAAGRAVFPENLHTPWFRAPFSLVSGGVARGYAVHPGVTPAYARLTPARHAEGVGPPWDDCCLWRPSCAVAACWSAPTRLVRQRGRRRRRRPTAGSASTATANRCNARKTTWPRRRVCGEKAQPRPPTFARERPPLLVLRLLALKAGAHPGWSLWCLSVCDCSLGCPFTSNVVVHLPRSRLLR
jgi:hypothetical protein